MRKQKDDLGRHSQECEQEMDHLWAGVGLPL